MLTPKCIVHKFTDVQSSGSVMTPSPGKDRPGLFERKLSDEKNRSQSHVTASTDTTSTEQSIKAPRRYSESLSGDIIVSTPREQPSPHSLPKKVAFLSPDEDDILMRSMDSGRSVSGGFKVMRDTNTGMQQV